ncbi:hypothetical protein G6K88_15655 [Agrobacterium rhizogenes]|uniref:hypothetical protein n=1 Tax=Rhizobium rhizogenes TaxID=359 RepID=UPI00157356BA|nr:hypothetical protein [Rhizobium rhizogenes]NTI03459.1 hypothetical protein [Rhizobium rhizogenes]NTI10264.1 hypothetical protein [Rhizobium rhizogenes]
MTQLDLFKWAESRPTAEIIDWSVPFARRVMERLHEFDDDWPRPQHEAMVVSLRIKERGAA